MQLYHFTIFSNIYLAVAAFSLLVALIICKHCVNLEIKYLALLEFAVTIWSFGNAFKIAATTLELKLLWSQISYIGICVTAVFFFMFALQYNKKVKKYNLRFYFLIFSIPALTLLLSSTNSYHHLIWQKLVIVKSTNGVFFTYGLFFWVFITFTYLILTLGIYNLVLATKRFKEKYKSQTILILVASFMSFIGNIIYVFKINPLPGLDITPLTMMISGIILFYTIYRFKIFILLPIARHNLVDTMAEGLLVIDSKDRIVDANPAIYNILDYNDDLLGKNINEILIKWPDLLKLVKKHTAIRTELEINNPETTCYDIKITLVNKKGNQNFGQLLILNNITEQKKLEKEQKNLVDELSKTLNEVKELSGLLPICASCKKIRDDKGYWHEVETYMSNHTKARFSQGLCPDCQKETDLPAGYHIA